MLTLFQYNWQVREDWFKWCKGIPEEELLKQRTGGMQSILHNLFHIVDVEQGWIGDLIGRPDPLYNFEDYQTLDAVILLSNECRPDIEAFMQSWSSELEQLRLKGNYSNGKPFDYAYGEIVRHVIAHEIHHIGQLSVWARELDLQPVSPNLIGRGLF